MPPRAFFNLDDTQTYLGMEKRSGSINLTMNNELDLPMKIAGNVF